MLDVGEMEGRFLTGAALIAMPGIGDPRFERALNVGGRLFLVVGAAPVMDAILVRRVAPGEWVRESLFETVIPPLMNAAPAEKFVF